MAVTRISPNQKLKVYLDSVSNVTLTHPSNGADQSAVERLQRLEQQGALKREAAAAALEEARALKAEAEAEHKETMAKLTERQAQVRRQNEGLSSRNCS